MIADMPGRLVSPITVGRGDELEIATRALDGSLEGIPSTCCGRRGRGGQDAGSSAEIAARPQLSADARASAAGAPTSGRVACPMARSSRPCAARRGARSGRAGRRRRPCGRRPRPAGAGHRATARDRSRHRPRPEPWQQARLMESLLGFLGRLAAARPSCWSSRTSIGPIRRPARPSRSWCAACGPSGCCWCMTFRADELHRRHPLLPWLAELERTGRVERIDLARLDAGRDPRAPRRRSSAPADPGLVGSIHRRSDGNPFFAEELLAASRRRRRPPAVELARRRS